MIQYYFNVEEKVKELNTAVEKYAFLRKSLMTQGKEYGLNLNYKTHQEFLGYYYDTKEKNYTQKKKLT